MHLPQELLEEILSYLPLDDEQDEQSLRNCSVVARSWVNPSRRRLFKMVGIRNEGIQLWLANVPSTNEGLLQHVRSFSYIIDPTNQRISPWTFGCDSRKRYHPDFFQDYLASFNQLRHLSLSNIRFTFQQVNIFSAFRHTLSRLTLDHCIIPFNTLVTLINYFSSLDRLDIYSVVSPEDDDEPTPLSRPVPKLHIADCYGRCDLRSLLGQLSTLGPVFDDIIIEGQDFLSTPTLQCILCTVGANAKRLKLLYDLEDHHPSFNSLHSLLAEGSRSWRLL